MASSPLINNNFAHFVLSYLKMWDKHVTNQKPRTVADRREVRITKLPTYLFTLLCWQHCAVVGNSQIELQSASKIAVLPFKTLHASSIVPDFMESSTVSIYICISFSNLYLILNWLLLNGHLLDFAVKPFMPPRSKIFSNFHLYENY